MKPLHVGLLVIGAALAGSLAMKMTQPPSAPAPPAPPAAIAKVAPAPPPVVVRDIPAPPPVYTEPPPPPPVVAKRPAPVAPPKPKPVVLDPVAARKYEAPAIAPPPTEVVKAPEPLLEPPPPPRQVILQAGTTVPVRLLQTIVSDHAASGDSFQATLAEPIVVDGLVIAERGASVTGRIVESKTAGRFSGSSLIELRLSSFQTADGQRIPIATEPWAKQTDGSDRSKNDAVKIGGGAALGAIIGAIAGGGKGAAIGAGAGGAAGAGTVAAQRPKPLEIPTETLIRFRLSSRVTITERPL